MRGDRRPPLVPLLLLLTAGTRAQQPALRQVLRLQGSGLRGSCRDLNFLDNLLFQRQPVLTASGAPYYKSEGTVSHPIVYYIYYDPNCMGHGDGDARWIIDSDQPSTTARSDLDGDGDCRFLGLVGGSAGDLSRPPVRAEWRLLCDGEWVAQEITLAEEAHLDHPTTTKTTTTRPPPTTTTTTPLPRMLRMEGACGFLNYLNSPTTWIQQGTTQSGAPYWKSMNQQSFYIYFDPDCLGRGHNPAPRWVIDNDKPSLTRTRDLDADGDCIYQAHIDSGNSVRPPEAGTWHMWCNHEYTPVELKFFEVTTTTTTTSTTSRTSTTTTTKTSTTTFTSVTKTITKTSTTKSTSTTSYTTTSITNTTTGTTVTTTDTITTSKTGTSVTTTTATTSTASTSTVTTEEVDEADLHGKCDSFNCPDGLIQRVNASDIWCKGLECADMDNMTCCEVDTTTATTTVPPPSYMRFTGICKELEHVGNAFFALQGFSAAGAPLYKALTTAGAFYVYHDVACNGTDIGSPRWILDTTAPDASRMKDLDGDKDCRYHGRLISKDSSRPPADASWRLYCGTWRNMDLQLEGYSSLPTTTTTPAPLTSKSSTQATATAAPTTSHAAAGGGHGGDGQNGGHGGDAGHDGPHETPSDALLLHGVCDYQNDLNGLVFMKIGMSALSSPVYKADNQEFYIFWDPHCDGKESKTARWVISTTKPNFNATSDLDGDQKCFYLAKSISNKSWSPPLDGTWGVYCSHQSFQDVHLTLKEAFARVPQGTCEAAGKVTITDAHACGLAGSYFNLSIAGRLPMNVPDKGDLSSGCFFDPESSQLQLVTALGAAAGHGGHGSHDSHGSSGHGSGHESHGEHASSGHGNITEDGSHGESGGHSSDSGHGSAHGTTQAPVEGSGHSSGSHGGEAGHGSEHGKEESGHGVDHGKEGSHESASHSGEGHRRVSAEAAALEALCAGGKLADPKRDAQISLAQGTRSYGVSAIAAVVLAASMVRR